MYFKEIICLIEFYTIIKCYVVLMNFIRYFIKCSSTLSVRNEYNYIKLCYNILKSVFHLKHNPRIQPISEWVGSVRFRNEITGWMMNLTH